VVAFAEALAAGAPWPPCAVPDQPTTRREGSSPPVSASVTSSADARGARIRALILEAAQREVSYGEILASVWAAWGDEPLRENLGPIVNALVSEGRLQYCDGRGLYQATPAPAATETRPTNDEAPRPIAHHAATLTAQERLLVELFGRLDVTDRDRFVLLAGMLSRGAPWPHEEAIDHYREGLFMILSGESDPVSTAALYLGEERPATPPVTAREPQRLGDTVEEERAADEWVVDRYGDPKPRVIGMARVAEGQPARLRALMRWLRSAASELAAAVPPEPSSAAGTLGQTAEERRWHVPPTYYDFLPPPEPSSAPTNCPQHGLAIEPDGFTSHCSRLPSCPGGTS
jgi:hypothetical protein